MTPAQGMAQLLNGREYRSEMTPDEERVAKLAGLVVVFGTSDDLMEFRGAISDEVGCCSGGPAYLTKDGLFERECHNDDCPHEQRIREAATKLEAVWCATDEYSWTYIAPFPHESFDIVEDGEKYCRGIVFNLADVAST